MEYWISAWDSGAGLLTSHLIVAPRRFSFDIVFFQVLPTLKPRNMDSQKHRDFVGEPMANKSVKELPGVGATLGNRFEKAGYSKASQVYGKYLVGNRNPVAFENFMKDTTRSNRTQAWNCGNALEGYYQRYNS